MKKNHKLYGDPPPPPPPIDEDEEVEGNDEDEDGNQVLDELGNPTYEDGHPKKTVG